MANQGSNNSHEGSDHEETISLMTPPSSLSTDRRDDKVLQEVQEKLKKQLLERKNEIEDRIYEQKRQLVRATKDREEAGVQLYDLQCNLSGLHASLNKTTIALTAAAQAHKKAREELDKNQKHWDLRSDEHKKLTQKTNETRQELDNITNTVKNVKQFNEKIRGDVALNRRATYATEEGVTAIEVLKMKQDVAIDECQERIKQISDKVAMAKAQLEAQKRESKISNLALREADIEMGSIHYEKRQLTFQWNSTLVVLVRCDRAIKILRIAMHQQAESKLGIMTEKKRYIKDTARVTKMNDRSKFMLLKIDSSMKETQKYIDFVKPRRIKILQQYAKVLGKVEKIQGHIELIAEDILKMEAEIKEINKQYRRETSKIHELENKILSGLLEQVILEEKGAEATAANIRELRKLVKDEDSMATDLNHELSRIRCDILAVQAYNQDVASALKAVNDNVASKYNLISKFDAEIKQKEREVDIKTKEIIRLTRKYEQLTANFDDSASSPWEAMMHSLKIEINQKMKESNESQKRWLSLQTSLVVLQNEVNSLSEKAQRAAYDQGVLTQRKYRVDMQYNMLVKAIKDLNIGIGQKRNLITRLNDLIGKNKTLETSLLDITENMQIQHYLALKDLAADTMELQSQLDNSIAEKDHASKHLDELEHHVMLWRYKVSFEIETQGVCYRKGIQGPTGFEAGLARAAGDLKKAIRDTDKSVVECDKRLIELEEQKNNLNDKIPILNDKLSTVLVQQEDCKERLRIIVNARSRAFLATAMYQRLVKKHEDFKNNKWKGVVVKKSINEDLTDAKTRGTTLIEVINELSEQLPLMQQKLDSLIIQIELALKSPQ
ncbi:hypothetical protein KC19_12G176300 [Ceratodon purpureus]|uniref:Coiled-coil domain-containing protein 40 n=1 Tax=Ceratodon purpureus TaxID=3225 RepID=A0A8T0GAP3_CERPU|nr:hypothetical protein KC19_12G176300 [Ceratodon purpureus]